MGRIIFVLAESMIPNAYLLVKSELFQKAEDEDNKLVNPGMYGCNLAKYLQRVLVELGYRAPFYCNEDWGWWVEIKGFPHLMGLCIYGRADDDGIIREYVICSGITNDSVWSWRNFKRINTTEAVTKLMDDIEKSLKTVDGINSLKRMNDMEW